MKINPGPGDTDGKAMEMTAKKLSPKKALTQTTKDYASRSTIHGIGYVFDKDLSIVERILWLLLVLASLAGAAYFTWNFWSQWRDEQVMKMKSTPKHF